MSSLRNTSSTFGRPLIHVAREIGRHLATIHRWRNPGVLDALGVRRRLRMTRVVGRWFVEDDDLRAFFDSLATGSGETHLGDQAAKSAVRIGSKQSGRVEAELDAAGIR